MEEENGEKEGEVKGRIGKEGKPGIGEENGRGGE